LAPRPPAECTAAEYTAANAPLPTRPVKQSPLLWYQDLTEALEHLGLHPIPGANCLYANEWLLLFFYVDDVVSLCHKQYVNKLRTFEQALFERFKIRYLGDLQWFLGIRINRDRHARKLWLCQDSYIAKIATKFNLTGRTRAPTAPLTLLYPTARRSRSTPTGPYPNNFIPAWFRPRLVIALPIHPLSAPDR
jgi:Reverse transcriptase (RNA-dependent DNA polymerase)